MIRLSSRAPLGALVLILAAACAPVTPRPGVITTTRLGMAKATGTLAAGVVQLEAGHSRSSQTGRTRQVFGEAVLRVGMGPRTELRAGIPSVVRTVTDEAVVSGFGDASLFVKHRLWDVTGFRPALAVSAGSTLPTGADAVGAGAAQPEAALSAEWRLPERLRLIGMGSHRSAVAAGDRSGVSTLAAGLRGEVLPGTLAQFDYGITHSTREGAADAYQVRLGAAARVGPNFQLDAWGGHTDAAGRGEWQVGLGLSRRW